MLDILSSLVVVAFGLLAQEIAKAVVLGPIAFIATRSLGISVPAWLCFVQPVPILATASGVFVFTRCVGQFSDYQPPLVSQDAAELVITEVL